MKILKEKEIKRSFWGKAYENYLYIGFTGLFLKINHKIPKKIRATRSQILRKLSEKKKMNFYKSNINQIRPVLFESKNYDGYIYGYTDNYVRVKTLWSKNLVDNVVDCELINIDDEIIMNAKVYEKETIALHL